MPNNPIKTWLSQWVQPHIIVPLEHPSRETVEGYLKLSQTLPLIRADYRHYTSVIEAEKEHRILSQTTNS